MKHGLGYNPFKIICTVFLIPVLILTGFVLPASAINPLPIPLLDDVSAGMREFAPVVTVWGFLSTLIKIWDTICEIFPDADTCKSTSTGAIQSGDWYDFETWGSDPFQFLSAQTGATIPEGITVTIQSGDTIIVFGSIRIDGTLINKGKIIFIDGKISNHGTFKNEGTIDFDVNFKILFGGSFKIDNTNTGTFINKGTIKNQDFTINNSGTIDNSGLFIIGIRSDFTNFSGANVTNSGTIKMYPSSSNENRGTINNSGGRILVYDEFINHGTINNLDNGYILIHFGTVQFQFGDTTEHHGRIGNIGIINNHNTISVAEKGSINNIGTINNFDFLRIDNSGTNKNSGNLINNGTISIWSSLTNTVNTFTNTVGIINNTGHINIQSSGELVNFAINNINAIINNNADGIIWNYGGNINNNGIINNISFGDKSSGIFGIENWGNIDNKGTLDNSGAIENSATFDKGVFANFGTVKGCGLWLDDEHDPGTITGNPFILCPTSITVSSSANPLTYGQSSTITVATSPPNTLIGNVTVSVDGTQIRNFDPFFVIPTPISVRLIQPSAGSHTITADYSGDVNHTPSTSTTLTQIVDIADTTTNLSEHSEVLFGNPVSLRALTLSSGPVTGTMTFNIDGTPQPPVEVSGFSTTFEISSLSAGSHTITADYSGDANNHPSTSNTITQNIVQMRTTIELLPSSTSSTFGEPVTFTARVIPFISELVPPGTVTFSIDGTPESPVTLSDGQATFTTSSLSAGTHTITADYSGDTNFEASEDTLLQRVTQVTPTISFSSSTNPSTAEQPVIFTASVSPSDVPGTITFTVDGTPQLPDTVLDGQATFTTSSLSAGSHTIRASYSGDANHADTFFIVSQTVNPIPATITLSSSANPSTGGQSVDFTATVSPSSATGTVTFLVDGQNQTPVDLSGGQATFTTSSLSIGSRTIQASYSGDENHAATSLSSISQTVNPIPATITLSSTSEPSVAGQAVSFTATLSPSTATGIVTFTIDGQQSDAGISGGTATSNSIVLNSAGSHIITADYSGDQNHASSNASFTQTVNPSPTTTTLSSLNNPSVDGQQIFFTAIVSSSTATGTMTLTVDGTSQSQVNVAGGGATFTTSSLSPGTHTITADYSGDANNQPGTSNIVTQDIIQAAAVTLSSSANPSTSGQSVDFTATVSPSSATGTVSFTIPAPQPPVNLSGGQATFTTSSIIFGSHTIQAFYSGDANNLPGTSNTVTQIVNQIPTTIVVSSSTNPSVLGQSVTLTATVSPSTVTRTVTFTVDGQNPASVELSDGQASITINNFLIGSHTFSASYIGDINHLPSTSDTVTQTVNTIPTTTTLSSPANPSEVGQPGRFTATVSPSTARGIMTFTVDGTLQSTVVVVDGIAQSRDIQTQLSIGSHTITASYSGNDDHLPSNSNSVTQIVNKIPTTITLSSTANPIRADQPGSITATISPFVSSGTITFTVDGTPQPPVSPVSPLLTSSLSPGSHTITASYSGDERNHPSTSDTLTQIVNTVPTTITLSSLNNPSNVFQQATFGISISPSSVTGAVTLTIDETPQPPVDVCCGNQVFSSHSLSPGSHTITADYSGDTNFEASSATLTQLVNRATTEIRLNSPFNPYVFGTGNVFVTASLGISGIGTPTGTMTFIVDGTPQPPVDLSSVGKAQFDVSSLSLGSHTIQAVYSGDEQNEPSNSSILTQTVNPSPSITQLISNQNPSTYGPHTTFTASIVLPFSDVPNDTVTFSIDGTPQPPVDVELGLAQFTTLLSPGSYTITADYSGAENILPSSATLTQTVNQAPATITLSPTANPSTAGELVSFVAGISPLDASGTVTFSIDGTPETPVALDNGIASFTTSLLSVGSHTITADYSGNANFLPTDDTLTQTVNVAPTIIGFSSPNNPSTFGQPSNIDAIVLSTFSGLFPTGTLTFSIDGTPQPPVTLSNGIASFDTSSLSVGSHTITASYSGDADFAPSSNSFTQIIEEDVTPPTITAPSNITVDNDPGQPGAEVTYPAPTVSDNAPGVTFSCIPTSGSFFDIGVSSVTCTATDAAGNTAIASFTVTVEDNEAPKFDTLLSDISLEAGSPSGTEVTFTPPTASDNTGPITSTCIPQSGTLFQLGTTLVTCTATDGSGNVDQLVFNVIIVDTTTPFLTVPADIPPLEATAVLTPVDIGEATATDIFPVVITNDTSAEFPLGTTTVTWTATDSNGNEASATQTVTVEDTTPPVLTVPADILADAIGITTPVDIGTATASDIFPVNIANNSTGEFPLGTTTVTWTATDSSGNTSTAEQNVTVDIINTIAAKGQRADVNDFLIYGVIQDNKINLDSGTTSFDLLLRYGPTIDPLSFSAVLNGVDITLDFTPVAGTPEGVQLTLDEGRNVLVLSIDGERTDGRTANEKDRLTFVVG